MLLDEDAREALRDADPAARHRGHARTSPEARVLAGRRGDDADAEELARAVHALGPDAVVVTGGHRDEATDVFFDGERLEEIPGERHPDGAAHGSGCTHSSTLAAYLARGSSRSRPRAGRKQIAVGRGARRSARDRGGAGPVDVFGLA